MLILLEARGGFEPPHKGFADLSLNHLGTAPQLERETGFEPATSTLARSHSTAELLPLTGPSIQQGTDGDNDGTFTLSGQWLPRRGGQNWEWHPHSLCYTFRKRRAGEANR